jgi:hypothetical protein
MLVAQHDGRALANLATLAIQIRSPELSHLLNTGEKHASSQYFPNPQLLDIERTMARAERLRFDLRQYGT